MFPCTNRVICACRKPSTKEAFAEQMRLAISMLAHVQIVVEKIAGKHGGMGRRRQAITYLETLKAISRLLLLACRREMIIRGGNVSTICSAVTSRVSLLDLGGGAVVCGGYSSLFDNDMRCLHG